jgi:phosphoserine phosphatase
MNVIIIRHGQTECNTQDMHQGANDALTPTGEVQARYVAQKLQSFPVDIILSSTFPRAKRTTEIVNELLRKAMP